jgi:hypothetical protein
LKYLDNLFFASSFLFIQIFSVHGEQAMSFIFNGGVDYYNKDLLNLEMAITLILTTTLYTYLTTVKKGLTFKATLGSAIGFLSFCTFSYISYLAKSTAILSIFLFLFLQVVTVYLLIVKESMQFEMEKEFWKFIVEFNTVIVRFILLVLITGVAILRFFAENSHDYKDFLGLIIYPTLIALFSIFQVCYWLILPAWKEMSDGYKIEKTSVRNKYNKAFKRTK